MRIDPKFTSSPIGAAAPQRRLAGARFALEGGGAASRPAIASTAPLANLDAVLALQGEDDPAERRRRSLKRGHALLDDLDRLKAALLTNRVATADLKALAARLAERREASGDPRLDELLAHIELRAEVEIAKLRLR